MALSSLSVNYGTTRYSYRRYLRNRSYSRENRPMTKSRLEWMERRKKLEEHELRKQRIIQHFDKKRKRQQKQNCDETRTFNQRNSKNVLSLQKEHIDTTAESSNGLILQREQLKPGHHLPVSDHKKTNSSKVRGVEANLAQNVTPIETDNIDGDIHADNKRDVTAVRHDDKISCTPSGQRQLSCERQDFSVKILTRNHRSGSESSEEQIRRDHTKKNFHRTKNRERNYGKSSGRDYHQFKPYREMRDTHFEHALSRRMQCHDPDQSRIHGATEYRGFRSHTQYGERLTSHAMIEDGAIMPSVHFICTHTPCLSLTAPTCCYFAHHVLPYGLGFAPACRPPFLPQLRFPQPRMPFGRNMQELHRNPRMRPNFQQWL